MVGSSDVLQPSYRSHVTFCFRDLLVGAATSQTRLQVTQSREGEGQFGRRYQSIKVPVFSGLPEALWKQ